MTKLFLRVCVCGGRDYFNTQKVYESLDYVLKKAPFTLISGGATGADTLGIQWAKHNGIPYEVYPANWKDAGKKAGILRNYKMIESGIDLLLAFPGGRGTEHMIGACLKEDIKVIRITDKPVGIRVVNSDARK